jgi:TetR/AcrR family transcriptional repressor of nem operon
MKTAQADSPTRTRLLDAAQALMLSKGFTATTVEEICEKAKLTKGSFFHYFASKDELGRVLLERFCADGERMHAAFAGADPDPLKRVYAYLDNFVKEAAASPMPGCLMGMFAQELCDLNPEIRATCERGFAGWAKAFGHLLAEAKAARAPKRLFEPQALAEHLIAVLEGSLILARAKEEPGVVVQNLRHYAAYVKSLFEG